MGKLTVKKVEFLTEPGRYSDGDGSGFHVRVDNAGRKYWIIRTNDNAGKRRDISIGPVKRMSLGIARERARQKLRDLELAGGALPTIVPTFRDAAKKAHEPRTAGYRNQKRVTQWISTLETHAYPLIGDKLVFDLTRRDVTQVLTPIWLKTPETARRVLQKIDRVIALGGG